MIFTRGIKVCLAVAPIDFRAGFESLAAMVERVLAESATSSSIFVFTNKRRNRIRLLYWDGTGLWLMTKKLEQGTFAWPQASPGQVKLALPAQSLELLLAGIDLAQAQRRPWFDSTAAA